MSRVGAQYKNKGELVRIGEDEMGDDFIGPFYDPVTTEEFTSTIKDSSDKFINTGVPPFDKVLYFSNEGNNDDEGTRIVKPKRTLEACISAAVVLGPSVSNKIGIVCLDASQITPIVTIPEWVNLHMPYAVASGSTGRLFTLSDNSSISIAKMELSGTAIGFHKETGLTAQVFCSQMIFDDDSICIQNAGSSNFLIAFINGAIGTGTMVKNTSSASGKMVVGSSAVQIIDATGVGIDQRSDINDVIINCDFFGQEPTANAIRFGATSTGTVTATIRDLFGDVNVVSGATFNATINTISGSIVANGTIKGNISNVIFSDLQLNDGFQFQPAGHQVLGITNDKTESNKSETDLITSFAAKKYADSFCIQRGYITVNSNNSTLFTSFSTVGAFSFNSITQSLDEMFTQWASSGVGNSIQIRVVYSGTDVSFIGDIYYDSTDVATGSGDFTFQVARTATPIPALAQ